MFDFEWTGRMSGSDEDHSRGVRQAEIYCRDHGYDAAEIWDGCCNDDENSWALWSDIEGIAIHALCHGWQSMPENVSLIWR